MHGNWSSKFTNQSTHSDAKKPSPIETLIAGRLKMPLAATPPERRQSGRSIVKEHLHFNVD